VLAIALPRFAPSVRFDELELMAEAAADGLQDAQGLIGDLRTDAIAAEEGKFEVHGL
jgi:hypothetical protein